MAFDLEWHTPMSKKSIWKIAVLPPVIAIIIAILADWITGFRFECQRATGALLSDACDFSIRLLVYAASLIVLHLLVTIPLSTLVLPRDGAPDESPLDWRNRFAVGLRFANYGLFLITLFEGIFGPTSAFWPVLSLLIFPYTASLEIALILRENAQFEQFVADKK
jgi:predicted permease